MAAYAGCRYFPARTPPPDASTFERGPLDGFGRTVLVFAPCPVLATIPAPPATSPAPAATRPPRVVVQAVLERITYATEETGHTIAWVATDRSGTDLLTVVGSLHGVQPGESLRLVGRWAPYPKYRRQFELHSYTTVLLATIQGIERYLGSGLIEVHGLGKKFVTAIGAAWEEQNKDRRHHRPSHRHLSQKGVEVAGAGGSAVHRGEDVNVTRHPDFLLFPTDEPEATANLVVDIVAHQTLRLPKTSSALVTAASRVNDAILLRCAGTGLGHR